MANEMITHPYVDQLDQWNTKGREIAEALDFVSFHTEHAGAVAALILLVDQLQEHVKNCPFPELGYLREWEVTRTPKG